MFKPTRALEAQDGTAGRRRGLVLGCVFVGCVVLALGTVARAADPECTTAICAGDPCTITGTHLLTEACDLDFGAKDVTVAPSARLESANELGSFRIEARRFTLRGTLQALGGNIDVTTSGDVVTGGERSAGRITVDGDLGAVTITAGGTATLAGSAPISASDGETFAGTIRIMAASVTLSQELAADGRDTDAGEIEITSTGSITTTGALHANATGADTAGGTVTLTAADDITIGDDVHADAGRGGGGGSITFVAGRDMTVDGPVSADGGTGGGNGGTITLDVAGNAAIGGVLRTRGSGEVAQGGTIEVDSRPGSAVAISGTLDATTSANGDFNGTITIGPACTVVLTGTLDTHGRAGAGNNVITYLQSLDVTGGQMLADAIAGGGNAIHCRCVNDPADGVCEGGCVVAPVGVGPSTIDPPATVTPQPLGPCIGCPNGHVELDVGEVCDDGNFDDGDGCESDCTLSCGNGVVTGTEQCDDGNRVDGDCCSATCQREVELDVDASGTLEAATDVVYIARRLLGLSAVPPSFRANDATIPPDRIVAGRVDALGVALDLDRNGSVDVASDVVYLARILLGISAVPPSFRQRDATIPPDVVIAANEAAVCRSSGPTLPPCTAAGFPTCAGACPAGNTCYAVGGTACVCAPTDAPCTFDGAVCGGSACPLGQACAGFGPFCSCHDVSSAR